ncbi:MAG: GntR family transcriptional regulator [Deltaproteobacteria bacterium]|nr:GntR family transcriptional regulator [Deltaproteobacteria bacterium]
MLKKAKSQSLVENVVQQIEDAILAGDYCVGDKLPATRQLQKILGASLGTIREGLARLEQKGLVEVRKGTKGGFFINDVATKPMTESLDLLMRHLKVTPRELFEFRATVEAGLIRLVVQRASDQQIEHLLTYRQKLEACLERGEQAWYALLATERALRKAFLPIVDNRIYGAVLLPIHNNIFQFADLHLKGDDVMTLAAYRYWDKILKAVAARHEERAATLTKEMIFHFMELILAQSQRHRTSEPQRAGMSAGNKE